MASGAKEVAQIYRSLVEVVRGMQTSEETTRTVLALVQQLGKTPVQVNDSAGFVSNRVLMPLLNEAMFTVMEGIATPESVDTVFKLGMAHPMGPLTLVDFIGLDVCLDIMRVFVEETGDSKYRPSLADSHGQRRLVRAQDRQGFLYVFLSIAMKSEAPHYLGALMR